jgi:hypothetical protein
MNSEQLNTSGRQLALISFLLGTLIFGIYFLTSGFAILFLGYAFIAIIGLLNSAVLLYILFKVTKDKVYRKRLMKTCGLMLINIPIMFLYCWFAAILTNTMRITFTNSTQTTLTDINIVGCKTAHIENLESGESKTVWVGISGDCTINIDYLTNGQRKEENVAGYVTNSMGQKIKHNIGGHNELLF